MIDFLGKIQKELDVFNQQFQAALSTKAALLHKITNYLNKSPGKKIRPICTILSAGLINNISDKTYRGAVLVELLHTATLIHDDIVDDAQLRRSALSINTIWKNKIAVLTGDYFLAKGLKLAVQCSDYDILLLISNVVQEIVEGELIQIEKKKIKFKRRRLQKLAQQVHYFKLHNRFNANADNTKIKQLQTLGMNIGMLFKLKMIF